MEDTLVKSKNELELTTQNLMLWNTKLIELPFNVKCLVKINKKEMELNKELQIKLPIYNSSKQSVDLISKNQKN